jgi:hypothetical protein
VKAEVHRHHLPDSEGQHGWLVEYSNNGVRVATAYFKNRVDAESAAEEFVKIVEKNSE